MHPLVAAEQAKIPESLKPFVPIEGLIDTVIKNLISTRVQKGNWTKEEQRAFDDLNDERVRRMGGRPPAPRQTKRRFLSFFRR